eukprot:scaffold11802_cov202-Skeletonema_dohrnii-CCMP3373.AAC.6
MRYGYLTNCSICRPRTKYRPGTTLGVWTLDKCKTVLSIGCPLRILKGAAGDHLQTSDLGVAEST